MKRLPIVYHTQFGGTEQMARATADGARAVDDVETVVKRACESGVADVLGCDALIVATSENFGSLSGMAKDFLGGAMLQTARIATGCACAKVHSGTIYRSGIVAQAHEVPGAALRECAEVGATLAAGLSAGIY